MRVVNMAYGAYYLLGGYIGLSIARCTGSFELAILGGGLAIVVLGYLVDRFLIRRTGDNHLAQVLLTVGVAFVIGDVALAIWGGDNLQGADAVVSARRRSSCRAASSIRRYRFALILFGIVVGLSLWLLYRKTQIGAVVRAGVDDREMVNATGINVDRLFVLVSALASFLAGMAGVVGGAFLTLNPGAEWDILVLALVVVIIGGLGSLEGAMLGSTHRRPARRLWPLAAAGILLLRAVRADGDPAAVPARPASSARSIERCAGIAVALGLLALAAALVRRCWSATFWITLLTQIMIFGLLALSADLLLGHAGLFSLCHASFFAVAAYTTAILQVRYGVSRPSLAAPAGILAGTLLALLFAVAVRTRGVYFILITHRVRLHHLGRRLSLGVVHRRRQRRDQRAVSRDRRAARRARRPPTTTSCSASCSLCAAGLSHARDSPFGLTLRGIKSSESRMRSLGYDAAGISMWRSCSPACSPASPACSTSTTTASSIRSRPRSRSRSRPC